jgi:hypothetical protein
MEKKVAIKKMKESTSDFEFWSEKSFQERLDALEFLREQYQKQNHVHQRLQRVYRIIKQA